MTERLARPPLAAALGASAAGVVLLPRPAAALLVASAAAVPLCWWTIGKPARWLALFFFAALLLPPLPIALGDSGPHVALVFVLLGLAAGAVRASEWRVRADPVAAALVFCFAVLLASIAMAALHSGGAIAAASLARVLLFGISLYVFFYVRFGPGRQGEIPGAAVLFWLGLGSALFACLDFYFQFPAPAGFGPQFVWLASGMYRRAQGVFYEASTLGNLCAFFLVMTAAALLAPKEQRPLPRWALAFGGAVFGAALIFSFSRASLANLGIAVTVLLALYRVRVYRVLVFLGSAAGAIALAGYLLPRVAELYWGRLAGTARFFFSATEAVLSGRADTWRALGGFLVNHPFEALVGVGYKTLPYSNAIGHPIVVDNMYLSMLAETGVLGLAALGLLNVAILRAAWKVRRSFYGAWILAFWTGQVFQMLSGDLLTYWRVLPVYFYVLALALRDRPA